MLMARAPEITLDDSAVTRAIRERMDEVRRDLDEDVQEIVEGARDLGQWRTYLRNYPWVGAGLALAAGYLIVPHRAAGMRSDCQPLAQLATPGLLAKGSIGGKLLEFAADFALKGLSRYVAQQAGNMFANPPARPPRSEQP